MTYTDALDRLAADPHVARYRQLCDAANPDAEARLAWRAKVVLKASGSPPSPSRRAGMAVRIPVRPLPPTDPRQPPRPCCGGGTAYLGIEL